MYLAWDPYYFLPLQTGWLWIFTPVKENVVVHGWFSTVVPWFDLYLYDNHYLDLRVVALDVVILAVLTIVIPVWCRRRQRTGRRWGFLSATTGLIFGFAIVGIGVIALSARKVLLAAAILTMAFYITSLITIVFRRKGRL